MMESPRFLLDTTALIDFAKAPSINNVVKTRCPHLWRTAGLLLTLYPDGP